MNQWAPSRIAKGTGGSISALCSWGHNPTARLQHDDGGGGTGGER